MLHDVNAGPSKTASGKEGDYINSNNNLITNSDLNIVVTPKNNNGPDLPVYNVNGSDESYSKVKIQDQNEPSALQDVASLHYATSSRISS